MLGMLSFPGELVLRRALRRSCLRYELSWCELTYRIWVYVAKHLKGTHKIQTVHRSLGGVV